MKKWLLMVAIILVAFVSPITNVSAAVGEKNQEDVLPLAKAHAHNDYEHTRPLLDALDHGFTSVESDVWLVNGELLVAHIRKTKILIAALKSLYLID